MERGRSFYLHAEIDIFRGRIRRLPHADGRGVGEIGGILNHRYRVLSRGWILGHQSDVGKAAGRQCGRDQCGGPWGSVEFDARGKGSLSLTEINAESAGALVRHSKVRHGAVRKI